jgi:hypothetical protein
MCSSHFPKLIMSRGRSGRERGSAFYPSSQDTAVYAASESSPSAKSLPEKGDPATGKLPVDCLLARPPVKHEYPLFTQRTGVSDFALRLGHPNASSTLDTGNL